jgi:hypothetical protein
VLSCRSIPLLLTGRACFYAAPARAHCAATARIVVPELGDITLQPPTEDRLSQV